VEHNDSRSTHTEVAARHGNNVTPHNQSLSVAELRVVLAALEAQTRSVNSVLEDTKADDVVLDDTFLDALIQRLHQVSSTLEACSADLSETTLRRCAREVVEVSKNLALASSFASYSNKDAVATSFVVRHVTESSVSINALCGGLNNANGAIRSRAVLVALCLAKNPDWALAESHLANVTYDELCRIAPAERLVLGLTDASEEQLALRLTQNLGSQPLRDVLRAVRALR
jgi:hypothetical protein